MRNKSFDAVELKDAIQTEHLRRRAPLSDERVRREIAERLENSGHPLAQLWRRIPTGKPARGSRAV